MELTIANKPIKARWEWAYLAVIVLVIFVPFFQGNYLDIPQSTDMKAHLTIINYFVTGQPPDPYNTSVVVVPNYAGQFIIGWPLAQIVKLIGHIEMVWLFFNFLALAGAALSLYFVTKKLVGQWAAILVVPFCIFVCTSVLGLFRQGVIFNIIDVGIILPWALYFSIKWFTTGGKGNFALGFGLLALFSGFHYAGFYTPAALIVLFVIAFVKKKVRRLWPFAILLIPWVILALFRVHLPYDPEGYIVPASMYFSKFLGLVMTGLVILAIGSVILFRQRFTQTTQVLLIIIAAFIAPLALGAVFNVAHTANRILNDMSTFISWGTACVLGTVIESHKDIAIPTALLGLAGLTWTLTIWL